MSVAVPPGREPVGLLLALARPLISAQTPAISLVTGTEILGLLGEVSLAIFYDPMNPLDMVL